MKIGRLFGDVRRKDRSGCVVGSAEMASGVKVTDEAVNAYNEIKLKHKFSYIVYRISDDQTEIIVEETGDIGQTYEDFKRVLKQAEEKEQCRYGIFDVKYTHNNMPRQKLAFILWSPDKAQIRQKMLYTSSKSNLRSKLLGIGVEVQATDDQELEMSGILEKCRDRSQ